MLGIDSGQEPAGMMVVAFIRFVIDTRSAAKKAGPAVGGSHRTTIPRRFGHAPELPAWAVLLAAMLGLPAADFLSGFVVRLAPIRGVDRDEKLERPQVALSLSIFPTFYRQKVGNIMRS